MGCCPPAACVLCLLTDPPDTPSSSKVDRNPNMQNQDKYNLMYLFFSYEKVMAATTNRNSRANSIIFIAPSRDLLLMREVF